MEYYLSTLYTSNQYLNRGQKWLGAEEREKTEAKMQRKDKCAYRCQVPD